MNRSKGTECKRKTTAGSEGSRRSSTWVRPEASAAAGWTGAAARSLARAPLRGLRSGGKRGRSPAARAGAGLERGGRIHFPPARCDGAQDPGATGNDGLSGRTPDNAEVPIPFHGARKPVACGSPALPLRQCPARTVPGAGGSIPSARCEHPVNSRRCEQHPPAAGWSGKRDDPRLRRTGILHPGKAAGSARAAGTARPGSGGASRTVTAALSARPGPPIRCRKTSNDNEALRQPAAAVLALDPVVEEIERIRIALSKRESLDGHPEQPVRRLEEAIGIPGDLPGRKRLRSDHGVGVSRSGLPEPRLPHRRTGESPPRGSAPEQPRQKSHRAWPRM